MDFGKLCLLCDGWGQLACCLNTGGFGILIAGITVHTAKFHKAFICLLYPHEKFN